MNRVEMLLSRLEKVTGGKGGQYTACCPAHLDSSPSLRIREDADGRILIHCLAGCGGADVMEAVGLSLSDLYPEGSLGDLKGYFQMLKTTAQKSREERDKLILAMGQHARETGKRLTAKQMREEQAAFARVRK